MRSAFASRMHTFVCRPKIFIDHAWCRRCGFEASSGWLSRFKRRKNLVSRSQTTSRSLPADPPQIYREFIQLAQHLIEKHDIKPRNIINMDQVPRYFETEPKSTITKRGAREVLLRKGGSSHRRCTATFTITGEGKVLTLTCYSRRKRTNRCVLRASWSTSTPLACGVTPFSRSMPARLSAAGWRRS